MCVCTGTVEEVQELRAQLEEEAEVSAQAYEQVQRAESELAQLRADYTALKVSCTSHMASEGMREHRSVG